MGEKEKKTREEQQMKTQLLKALSSGQWSDGIRLSLSTFLSARHEGCFEGYLKIYFIFNSKELFKILLW